MFKYERAELIMEILKKYKYTTVDFLVKELHYSPATIRRDLTYLEANGLVKKSYGGVSINEYAKPVIIREHENIDVKTRIAKKASELINEHNSVFVDGTTTTYFLGEFLKNKKNITVTTSNLKLATYLGENNVKCYVMGGRVIDTNMLCGSSKPGVKKTICSENLENVNYVISDGNFPKELTEKFPHTKFINV